MPHTIPTEEEISKALARDCFYGQIPERIFVPVGYRGAMTIQGIPIVISEDAKEPYVVPAEGGRLALDGHEL